MEVIIETVRKVVQHKKNFCEQEGNSFAYTEIFHCIPFTCYLEVNEVLNIIQYRAYSTFTLTPDTQEQMITYLAELNYSLAMGCFVYSPKIHELRYKNSLAFGHERPTENAIATLVTVSEAIMNEEIYGLIKIHNGRLALEVLGMPKTCT